MGFMSYKRNQVEDALIRSLPSAGADADSLRISVKRLLDTDRRLGGPAKPRTGGYAFYSAKPPGSGTEVLFSAYEAEALRLGVVLMNGGLPQATAVRVLRDNRIIVEAEHERILQLDPKSFRKIVPAPGRIVDAFEQSVYLVIAAKSNATGVPDSAPKSPVPTARICRSEIELSKFTSKELGYERVAMVINLTGSSFAMAEALKGTEPSRRGKK